MRYGKRNHTGRLPDRPKRDLRPVSPDQAVLNLLSKSRADLAKPRPISFYLYFPSRNSANEASRELKGLGFSVERSKSGSDKNWPCLARKDVIPRIGELTSLSITLERLARRLDGEYDGWETALDADEGEGLPNVK